MRAMLLILLATAPLAGACGGLQNEPSIEIENARVTLPAVKDRPGAAYFTVTAINAPARITRVTSPRVERIELHESMAAGMGPLRDPSLPADQPLSFEPGGRHAMLFAVDPALRAGDTLPLTFSFEGSAPVTVQAQVEGPGGGKLVH